MTLHVGRFIMSFLAITIFSFLLAANTMLRKWLRHYDYDFHSAWEVTFHSESLYLELFPRWFFWFLVGCVIWIASFVLGFLNIKW